MLNKRKATKRQLVKITKQPWFIRTKKQGTKKTYWFKCCNPSCNKVFGITQKRFNQGVGKYCSQFCARRDWTGEDNPNWKGGLKNRQGRLTNYLRKKIIEERGARCENCGFDNYKECIEVHHIIPAAKGGTNNPKNLIVLCSICHRYLHATGNLPDFSFPS